jgi:hypothetical protein
VKVYKKFSKNALNYGGGPSFGTAQFSADLEKKKVISSRDKLGLSDIRAPWRGGPGHAHAPAGGVPGMLAPVPKCQLVGSGSTPPRWSRV